MIYKLLILWLIVALLFTFSMLPSGQPTVHTQQGISTPDPVNSVVTNLESSVDPLATPDTQGDYYVNATKYLSVTNYSAVQPKIEAIAGHIPGGLVFEGIPPFFESFISHEVIPLPNWPQNAVRLLGITTDGRKGFVSESGIDGASYLIDFSTGALTSFPTNDPRPSPDASWIIMPGLATTTAVARNISSGKDIPLCSPYATSYRWSLDSTKILAINGTEQVVYITDLRAGNCTIIKMPGLDWNTEVLINPKDQKLIIILPGNRQTGENGRLMTANLDGTGQKKITALPFIGRKPGSVALVSPDGTAVYVEGFVVDLTLGHLFQTPYKAVAWLRNPPPAAVVRNLQVSVSPRQGERGTRFRFNMVGGPIEQEVTWFVSRNPDRQPADLGNTQTLDQTGSLNDHQNEFGFDTGLPTDAGDYYILVYIGDKQIGSGSFTVTEP